MTHVNEFFATARERYQIKLRRESGTPPPWTEDHIFREWRFCNVHREDDKTTVWFREHVRRHLEGLAAIEATVIYRWFNRIETGERVEDLLLNGWDTAEARRRLTGVQPLITGAYIIHTHYGMSKLDSLLLSIDEALPTLARIATKDYTQLRDLWEDLQAINNLGKFMAYEIVSDLRWTPVLAHATDIMTWANAGPGCTRGIGRVVSGNPLQFTTSTRDQTTMLGLMRELLSASQDVAYWPQDWKPWEMREVEHWACEVDKYMRVAKGGSLKRRFTYTTKE